MGKELDDEIKVGGGSDFKTRSYLKPKASKAFNREEKVENLNKTECEEDAQCLPCTGCGLKKS